MNWVKKGLPSFWTDYLRSDTYWVAAPEPVTSWQPIAKEADACFRPHVSQMHMQPGKPMFQRLSCHVRIRSCQQKSFKEILFYLRNMLGLDLTLNHYNSQLVSLLYPSRIKILLGEWKSLCNIYWVSCALQVLIDIVLSLWEKVDLWGSCTSEPAEDPKCGICTA